MYDIIGDVHGNASELLRLMSHMGYSLTTGGVFTHHRGRKPVFIGDYIDRGPDCKQVIKWVRATTGSGRGEAIMGNHEYNAVQWATPDLRHPGAFLRPHNERNYKQHAEFLKQMKADPDFYKEAIHWFKSLPLYLERDNYRFVHACWHRQSIDLLKKNDCLTPDRRLTEKSWAADGGEGSACRGAVEMILKGPEAKLGHGLRYADHEGTGREVSRIAWWKEEATTIGEAFVSLPPGLSFASLPYDGRTATCSLQEVRRGLREMPADVKIFIGHICEQGDPRPLSDKVACVDYGSGKQGQLVAYRTFAGETDLKPQNFIRAPSL